MLSSIITDQQRISLQKSLEYATTAVRFDPLIILIGDQSGSQPVESLN